MLGEIYNNQDKDYILDFIDKFKKDWQSLLSIMASKIIEGIDIISADSDSDSDSDNDFGNLITEEDQPILTDQQRNEILLLKPLLQQDGHRRKIYFTKEEYSIGIMITKICNNNHKSYILGLEVLFSEARAKAILNKIIS